MGSLTLCSPCEWLVGLGQGGDDDGDLAGINCVAAGKIGEMADASVALADFSGKVRGSQFIMMDTSAAVFQQPFCLRRRLRHRPRLTVCLSWRRSWML